VRAGRKSRRRNAEPIAGSVATLLLQSTFLRSLRPPARRYELGEVARPNTYRVVDAHVRKIAVLAELVDGPRPDGEMLGYLGHSKKPVAPAPEHLQVAQRGRRARAWHPFNASLAPSPYPARLRTTMRRCRARVG
jgi:hypothetical protein